MQLKYQLKELKILNSFLIQKEMCCVAVPWRPHNVLYWFLWKTVFSTKDQASSDCGCQLRWVYSVSKIQSLHFPSISFTLVSPPLIKVGFDSTLTSWVISIMLIPLYYSVVMLTVNQCDSVSALVCLTDNRGGCVRDKDDGMKSFWCWSYGACRLCRLCQKTVNRGSSN